MNLPTADEAKAIRDRIGDRLIVASVSGGKDSAAMCLYLRELGLPFAPVFLDTGWEHPLTYEYLRGTLTACLGPIVELHGRHDMPSLVRSKGMFASRQIQYCTEELKRDVIGNHLASLMDSGTDVLNAIGIRRGESKNRANAPEWEWSDILDCEVWRPVVAWSVDDVITIHQRHGLTPNPLYLRGFSRVGCFPCKNWKKNEIRLGADMWPERFTDEIPALESEVHLAARERYDRYVAMVADGRADELTEQARRSVLTDDGAIRPYNQPTFFQAPTGYAGPVLTVDRVVEWSRTIRGGRIRDTQIELFAGTGINDGCLRWGLCDTAENDE